MKNQDYVFAFIFIFTFSLILMVPSQVFSELFTNMELYTETLRLPSATIETNERYMLFDTTNIANMSKVTVTTNIPCDSNGNPKLKVAAGTLENFTNVIDSSTNNLNFTGPDNSCTFSGTVLAADENITINRVWLTPNNGTNKVKIGDGKLLTLTALLAEGNKQSPPPPPFSPTDISNLHAWYDASDINTITKDGSDRVSQWDDKSGNNFHLLQTTGGNQPLWTDDYLNGQDVIYFDAARFMQTSSGWSPTSQPYTVYFVVKMPANDSQQHFLISQRDSAPTFEKNDQISDKYIFTSTNEIHFTQSGFNGTWVIGTLIANGTNSSIQFNDVQKVTGDASTTTFSGLTVGVHGGITGIDSVKWRERVAEIIFYDKLVAGAEDDNLIGYLADKWGITT